MAASLNNGCAVRSHARSAQRSTTYWWPAGYRLTAKIFWHTGKNFTSDQSSKDSIFSQHLLRLSLCHKAGTIIYHTHCARVHLIGASSIHFHIGKMAVVRPSCKVLARKSCKCSGLQFFSLPTENCREGEKPARKPISTLVSSFLILSGTGSLEHCAEKRAEPAEGTDVVGVTDRC